MRTIIAGPRSVTNYNQVVVGIDRALSQSLISITEVVSGRAKGVDELGARWARENGIPVKGFPADWKDFTPPCKVKENAYGKYNVLAGLKRNIEMARYADALIAIWNRVSTGTGHMIKTAHEFDLLVYVHYL